MSLEKCVVVNCSALSHVRLQGALLDEAGLAFRVEGNAAYLGAVVGPDAEHGFRAKTRVKHLTSVADIRDTAGLARSRLVTYMMFASSVLHYLAQLVLVPIGLQRAEAATVASLLVAPVWAFSPDALSSIPQNILRLTFRALPLVAESSLRLALAHPELAKIRDIGGCRG